MASYSRLTREWWQSLGANHILLKPKLPPHYTPLLSISGSLFLFFLLKVWSPVFAFPSECGKVPHSSLVFRSKGSPYFFVQKICLGMSLFLESWAFVFIRSSKVRFEKVFLNKKKKKLIIVSSRKVRSGSRKTAPQNTGDYVPLSGTSFHGSHLRLDSILGSRNDGSRCDRYYFLNHFTVGRGRWHTNKQVITVFNVHFEVECTGRQQLGTKSNSGREVWAGYVKR